MMVYALYGSTVHIACVDGSWVDPQSMKVNTISGTTILTVITKRIELNLCYTLDRVDLAAIQQYVAQMKPTLTKE